MTQRKLRRKHLNTAVTAKINISVSGKRLDFELAVPKGPVRPTRLLPLFRSVSESFVNLAVSRSTDAGFKVSCAKGCGACCRQLVPISETDARNVARVVNEMPEPRRNEIVARFEAAKVAISKAGLLETLHHPEQISNDEFRLFGLKYFHEGVACPFLEDESCSIHPERPLVCREYLVVSPPENCGRTNGQPVEALSMPAKVSQSVNKLTGGSGSRVGSWVPLILALDWARSNANEPSREGTDWVEDLFGELAKRGNSGAEPELVH